MDLGLSGDVALVTGGAGRPGRGICTALAREGAQVAIVDRRSAAAREVAPSLSRRARAVEADVGDAASISGRKPWISGSILPATGGSHSGRTYAPLSRGGR